MNGQDQQPEATEDNIALAQDETSESDIEQFATELTAPARQVFQVGDRVEINSVRHGADFDWQIGIVTAATTVGAAANVNGTLRYFCSDELVLVEAAAETKHPSNNLFPSEADANWKAEQKALAISSAASDDDF